MQLYLYELKSLKDESKMDKVITPDSFFNGNGVESFDFFCKISISTLISYQAQWNQRHSR
jgi:hypothetical protein